MLPIIAAARMADIDKKEFFRERNRVYRQTHQAAGLCVICTGPAAMRHGKQASRCEYHLGVARRQSVERRQAKKVKF